MKSETKQKWTEKVRIEEIHIKYPSKITKSKTKPSSIKEKQNPSKKRKNNNIKTDTVQNITSIQCKNVLNGSHNKHIGTKDLTHAEPANHKSSSRNGRQRHENLGLHCDCEESRVLEIVCTIVLCSGVYDVSTDMSDVILAFS